MLLPDAALILVYLQMLRPTIVSQNVKFLGIGDTISKPVRLVKSIQDLSPKDFTTNDILIDAIESKAVVKVPNNTATDSTRVIILTNSTKVPKVEIYQRIYFYDVTTRVLFESYLINSLRIVNDIARIEQDSSGISRLKSLTKQGFLARRSNLQGEDLTVLVAQQKPFMDLSRLTFKDDALVRTESGDELFPADESEISGMFQDVTNILKKQMNFTTSTFKRRDGVWGTIRNGSWYKKSLE